MSAPLTGLKVIELARVLAGPWAGQTLSDLGAGVIKVESPAGDDTRQWGPPFIERDDDRSAAYFHSTNRGKASVVVDLRTPEGQEKMHALLADADILIENFKTGGLAKYGMDYDSLKVRFPKLIYCSITGFGQRSEEHTSELQSHSDLVCRLLLEKKKTSVRKHVGLYDVKWLHTMKQEQRHVSTQ